MSVKKYRQNERNKFTKIGNGVFHDKNLSFKERGVLSTLFSLPEDWVVSVKNFAAESSDSESSVYNTFKSLEQKGYISREQSRDERGRLREAEYKVADYPMFSPSCKKPDAAGPDADKPDAAGPVAAGPVAGKRTAYKKDTYKERNNKKYPYKRDEEDQGSFDTKDFFEAAVRRSYGKSG